jgi:hypothetical protein
MAITTLDGLIAALADSTAQHWSFFKVFTPQILGSYHALWNMPGNPGAAVTPSSGVAGDIPTDATAGAFPFTNPAGGANSYLSRLALNGGVSLQLILYDRLWHNSGLSPTTTTAQTVNSVALTRPDALGGQVEAWMQVYAAMGAGAGGTMTITYTDQDGNTGNTATLQGFAVSAAAGRSFPYALASGDTGVRSIQAEQHTTTMTSGTYGLVLRRKLMTLSLAVPNQGVFVDTLSGGMPEIPDDACLELVVNASNNVAQTTYGAFSLAQG